MTHLWFTDRHAQRCQATGARIQCASRLVALFAVIATIPAAQAGTPDLAIITTHSANFTPGQTGAAYSITVGNSGTGPTIGTVTVMDTVPALVTATAIGGAGWGCTQPSGPCTRGDALAPGANYAVITLTVNVANTGVASVTNIASVAGGGDASANNNTASDFTTIAPANASLGNWTPLTKFAPSGAGTMLLLTDGSAMIQSSSTQNWMRLTPDALGSYINGDWNKTPINPMSMSREYYAANVLPSGKVFILGGEYSGASLTLNLAPSGEIYDPISNTWSPTAPYPPQNGCPKVTDFPGNIVFGSPLVTGLPFTTGFQIGWTVSGTGIPNSVIISVDSPTQIQVDPPASATRATSMTLSLRTNGNVAAGSTIVSGIASTAGIQTGWTLTGPAIPSSTTVLSVDSPTQIHISHAATSTLTSDLLNFSVSLRQPACFGDDPTILLPGGKILVGNIFNFTTNLYDIATNTWSPAGSKVYDRSDEEGWAKLADGSIITYDIFKSNTSNTGYAERYDPATNTWSSISPADGTANGVLPVLSSSALGSELGPLVRLPDDRVFVIGANGHTALYTPSTNTWTPGPDAVGALGGSPFLFGADDAPAAALPNGHVLFAADAGPGVQSSANITNGSTIVTGISSTAQLLTGWAVFGTGIPSGTSISSIDSATQIHISNSATTSGSVALRFSAISSKPTQLFDFDPSAGTIVPLSPAIPDLRLNSIGAFVTRMLVLPTGEVLFSDGSSQLWIYTSTGAPNPTWQPAISQVVNNGNGVFTLTGTQLNGQSAGASYGDDVENDENYPIVRLVSGTGNVYYARTTNWSSVGVGGGANPEAVNFKLNPTMPPGLYSLIVSGAGISSAPAILNLLPVPPDLTVTQTHTGTFLRGQTVATYSITIGNSGNVPTSGEVDVIETVPTGLAATAIFGSGWSCAQPAGPCSRTDILAAGSTYPVITLLVNVALNAPAVVISSAAVSLSGETNTSNNTANDPTTILALGPSISSISPNPVPGVLGNQTIFINGSGFLSGAGLRVRVTLPAGQNDLQGSQVRFLSASQLSIQIGVGTTAANGTVQVFNPDGSSSNVFAFAIAEQLTTNTFALPQFVFGGAWYTALYFSNTTNSPANVTVNFIGDDGTPLHVPLVGIGTVTSQTVSVNPQSTVILEALDNTGTAGQGWVEASVPTGVVGYAVFRQVIAGRADQEAVVPLTPETSQAADLTYDDIALITSVAFLNPSNQPVIVTIVAYGQDGSPVGTSQVALAARSKQAVVLKTLPGLSSIFGLRGRAVFSVATGAVSVLGLRFGGAAFTSIPVVHRPAIAGTSTITAALPQLVFGDPWYTAIYLSNTTDSMVSVPVIFTANDGTPLATPLSGIGIVSAQAVTLDPGATVVLEAPNTGSPGVGWAQVSLPPGVTGYTVFRQVIAGRSDQEAVVPLTSETNQIADLIYDDTAFVTSVAFLNPSDQPATVTITVYSANGAQIGSTQVALAPQSKVATILKDLPGLSGIAGNRGWANFSVPNGAVSVLGLRFGGEAFTSIPVAHR